LETFIATKAFVRNPRYNQQRENCLAGIKDGMIDKPIAGLIQKINQLPFCFTLQSCFGHFLYENQRDPSNLDPLPVSGNITEVEYRIAYLAMCIEESESGLRLFKDLKDLPGLNPSNIQFGSAEWFWRSQVNSFVLQVEPERFKYQDTAILGFDEAVYIEKLRLYFYDETMRVVLKYATGN